MQQFYGYGDFAGDYWLIGKEEGGAGSDSEVALHLNTWDEQGRPELADVAELQSQKGEGKYFTEKAPLHKTWRGLVRLVLAAEKGASPTTRRGAYLPSRTPGTARKQHGDVGASTPAGATCFSRR